MNNHPQTIEKISQLPARVKSSKVFDKNQINVLRKKGLSMFAQQTHDPNSEKNEVESILFEELIPSVQCEFDEKRIDLSKNFWKAYNDIKEYKPTYRSGRSEIALESKAHENLKIALKLIDPKDSSTISFIKTLIKDIKKYHTLSKRTLGRIGRKQLSKSASDKLKKDFFDEIKWIQNQLGEDYLELILKRVEKQELEVIIAVENQNL